MYHIALNFDHFAALAGFMHCGIIQIRIDHLVWIARAPRFTCGFSRDQLMKQFIHDSAVMGKFIRYKQWFADATVSQVFQPENGS